MDFKGAVVSFHIDISVVCILIINHTDIHENSLLVFFNIMRNGRALHRHVIFMYVFIHNSCNKYMSKKSVFIEYITVIWNKFVLPFLFIITFFSHSSETNI